jgi:predicted nucleic acid-binding protein
MSALTQIIGAGQASQANLTAICAEIAILPIVCHAMQVEARIVEIALSLKRRSAYDAAYLALAEQLGAELWTLDNPFIGMRSVRVSQFDCSVKIPKRFPSSF